MGAILENTERTTDGPSIQSILRTSRDRGTTLGFSVHERRLTRTIAKRIVPALYGAAKLSVLEYGF